MINKDLVLVTGSSGFTGHHLIANLKKSGFEYHELKSDILDYQSLLNEIIEIKPNYVIHLAAISYTDEKDLNLIYSVNVIGAENLLRAIVESKIKCKKCILASSASVYGNQEESAVTENSTVLPINHYGISKYAMECISNNYTSIFPIIITRPFNYTGLHQNKNFLIPKIVSAYIEKQESIELGNLDIFREFNDVRDISEIYRLLLTEVDSASCCFNLCSGKTYSISNILEIMNDISNHNLKIIVNKSFIRTNEIKFLSGNPENLKANINYINKYSIEDTLSWMYHNE